jgi:hypothetical protein
VATTQGLLKDGIKIGGAALPALVTGAATAALPGLVGSLISGTAAAITSAAPAAASATLNPLTWLPALFGGVTNAATAAGSAAVSTAGLAVTGILSAVAMPIAFGTFGFAAYRAYSAWRAIGNMHKNDLKMKVIAMVDDGCAQVAEQFRKYQKARLKILAEYEQKIEENIERADARIAELLTNRPSPSQIQALEDAAATFAKQKRLLEESDGDARKIETASSPPLVEDLRSVK